MSNYTLGFYAPVKLGNGYIGNVTRRVVDWRRSIRAVGGFWSGTANYQASQKEQEYLFLNGLMWDLQEKVGNLTTWQGFLAEMEYTDADGVTWVRSMADCANAIKGIYTKVGSNLLSNGGAETSLWSALGSPSTLERVTTWRTQGTYSVHIVTDAEDEGAIVETAISITAGIAYQCSMTVNVESGTWKLEVRRSDTGAKLTDSAVSSGTGEQVLTCRISKDNEYGGETYVQIRGPDAGTECYCDDTVYQIAPVRAETNWYEDDVSIADFGRIEDIRLESSRTDEAMAAICQSELNERAWPRTEPPSQLTAVERILSESGDQETKLALTFLGYVFTLNWRHASTTGGTDEADAQVSSLVGEQSDYLTAGVIEDNTLDWRVEERHPPLLWDALEDIVLAGDASGNRWEGGVYGSRKFDYRTASTAIKYHYCQGRVLDGNRNPAIGPLVRPGLVQMDDMPMGPTQVSGRTEDDPRVLWIPEVEFIAPHEIVLHRER